VTVEPEVTTPEPPVATDNETTTPFDTAVTFDVITDDLSHTEEDLDPTLLKLLDADGRPTDIVTITEGIFTAHNDGRITFTPAAGFVGESMVTYQIVDSLGQSASAVFKVTVEPEVVDPTDPDPTDPGPTDPNLTSPRETRTNWWMPLTGADTSDWVVLGGAFVLIGGLLLFLRKRKVSEGPRVQLENPTWLSLNGERPRSFDDRSS